MKKYSITRIETSDLQISIPNAYPLDHGNH